MDDLLELLIISSVVFGPVIFGAISHWHRVRNAPCGRCKGTGYLPQYKHIHNGVCFRCSPPPSMLVSPQERLEKQKAAIQKEIEAQKAEAKFLAEEEEFYRSHSKAELMEMWESRGDLNLTDGELAILRKVVREAMGITPAPTISLKVCGDCGMVGSNCSCRRV